MELVNSFRATTIADPPSIRLPTVLKNHRNSNVVSFDTAGARGWSCELKPTSQNRLIIEAVRKKKTGDDHANSNEAKWINFGLVTESLSNGMFRVDLLKLVEKDGHMVTQDISRGYLAEKVLIPINVDPIIGYASGKMRSNRILILPGDVVKIEVSRYDPARGRIIYRLHPKELKQKEEEDENLKHTNGKLKKNSKSKGK